MKLKVAGAQIPVTEDIHANTCVIERAIDYAASENADILVTPEGSVSGFTPRFDKVKVKQAIEQIVDKAALVNLGLAIGTCYIEEDDLCYNQLRFYDSEGNFLGYHSKILRCGTMTNPPEGEINDYETKPLRTFDFHGVTIGGLICNDMWANPLCTTMPDPHLSQQLSEMGAKVILHAVNGARNRDYLSQVVAKNFHESNLILRAMAGKIWIVTVDNSFPEDIPNSSYGGVISPKGEWSVKMSDKGESFFAYSIEIE